MLRDANFNASLHGRELKCKPSILNNGEDKVLTQFQRDAFNRDMNRRWHDRMRTRRLH